MATGDLLSDKDCDDLVEDLLTSRSPGEATFGLEQLPGVDAGDPQVRLVSIEHTEHVNALVSDKPLTFDPTGFTIIYGDNGSGKSGYARLLKRIARARHREEVLSDVFSDSALAKPKARLKVKVGDDEKSITWPESTPPELQRMLFYDNACGDAYAATESDFPYRPSALFVMDGLIEACVAIRSRIDARLEENARSAKALPVVEEDASETDIGKYLKGLSSSSSLDALDSLIEKLDASTETIDDLKGEEARLGSADTTREKQRLNRQADKLDSLKAHLKGLEGALGDDAVATLKTERDQLKALDETAALLAKSFESEPLPGVGTSAWKELWESARRFSEAHTYPGDEFPVVTEGASCVLCHQPLKEVARERLSRFEHFVRDDTQTRLREAQSTWDTRLGTLVAFRTSPEAVETHLKDLEGDYANLVFQTRGFFEKYEAARTSVLDALSEGTDLTPHGLTPIETSSQLEVAAGAARVAAQGLSEPEQIKDRLRAVTSKRKELELLQEVKKRRMLVADEITRLKERDALEEAKSTAATGPITKKVLQLSEDNITEVLRDTFTRETDRLRLERVTIAKTRGDLGAVLHRPKLVGTRQAVTLPRVLSEGERTALGLAAFFTEAHLDASHSALVLDDPVSSLDHIRRELVATRLAQLAQSRQVVLFTHDAYFVSVLKREAKGLGVPLAARSVTRGRGGDRKPGTCSTKLPWKAKDVPERLDELRSELARINRDHEEWDDSTYEGQVATWAGNLSETWERIFSQEVVGPVLAEGGLEVRPNMVESLARFSDADNREFQASYSRVSQWVKRHDKSAMVNYVAPEISILENELTLVARWFSRVKGYKNQRTQHVAASHA